MATKKTTKKKPATKRVPAQRVSAPPQYYAPQPQYYAPQPQQSTVTVENKTKRKIFKPLLILVAIILAITYIAGLGMQIAHAFGATFDWLNQEVIERVDLHSGFEGVLNGGLTPQQIEAQFLDTSTPFNEDKFYDFHVKETERYVIIYRRVVEGAVVKFPNISFVKTNNGLVYDGSWGVTANVPRSGLWGWGAPEFDKMTVNFTFDLSDYTVKNDNVALNVLQFFVTHLWAATNKWQDNVVSFSSFNTDFAHDFWNLPGYIAIFYHQDQERLYNAIYDYLYTNLVEKYFLKLDVLNDGYINFINSENNDRAANLANLNSFATYLFNSSKTADKAPKQTNVVISDYYKHFISEALKTNYPIPSDKLALHAPETHYGIYKNEIVANTAYSYSETVLKNRNTEEIVKNTVNKPIAPIPQTVVVRELVVKLNNANNAPLSNINLANAPIYITFGNGKALTYNTLASLSESRTIALAESENVVTFMITSHDLIFAQTSGSITTPAQKNELVLDFTFFGGSVNANFKLIPITSVDTSQINLSQNPVTITLINSLNQTYTFTFSNTQQLTLGVTRLIPVGSYNYTISSNLLQFNDLNGQLEISAANPQHYFTYSLVETSNSLTILDVINIIFEENYSTNGGIIIYPHAINIIGENFTGSGTFSIQFFNSADALIHTSQLTRTGNMLHGSLFTAVYPISKFRIVYNSGFLVSNVVALNAPINSFTRFDANISINI